MAYYYTCIPYTYLYIQVYICIYILYIPYVAMKLCTPIKRWTMKEFLKVQPDNTRYKHKIHTQQHTQHTHTTTTHQHTHTQRQGHVAKTVSNCNTLLKCI